MISASNSSFARLLWSALAAAALSMAAITVSAQRADFSTIQIKTTKLTDSIYTLEGSGGTIGVLAGPDGVFMVDGQFAALTQKIVAAIKQISNAPIRYMVNTHVHGDHTGGNENLGKMGVVIISRPQLRERLMHPSPAANGTPGVPAPAAALPVLTYEGQLTMRMNGEEIQMIAIPRAHTDGDTMVYFPKSNVILSGDFYRSVGYPNIDRTNGGSLNGLVDGLGALIGIAGPNTKIVPGHGPTVGRAEVTKTRDMLLVMRDRIVQMVAQGRTQQETLDAHPTADYDASVPEAKNSMDRFVTQMYQELKAAQ